jgi:hypothetical protein
MANSNGRGPTESDIIACEAAIARIRDLVGGDPLREWELKFGEPPPQSIDDLIRWAQRVGWDGEYVRKGHWNFNDLMPFIEGRLQALQDARLMQRTCLAPTPKTIRSEPTAPCGTQKHIFQLKGKDWNIRYDGGALFAVPRAVGLARIYRLIQNQGHSLSAMHLRADQARQKSDPTSRTVGAAKQFTEDPEIAPSHVSNAGLTIGDEELKRVRDELTDYDTEIARLKRDGDEVLVAELEKEREELVRSLRRDTFKGKAKVLNNENTRARRAIRKSIEEAIERIKQKDAICAQHLENSIVMKDGFEYRPDREIAWQT